MVRWLAPILSFTAEEAWGYLPGIPNESVFFNTWHQFPAGAERVSPIDWPSLIALKADVARELERLRGLGSLGSSLEADVTVYVPEALEARFQSISEELRFLLITGQADVASSAQLPEGAVKATQEEVWIAVKPSVNPKCVRCYQLRPDVGSNPNHPEICLRCVLNVEGPGEERHFA
jgi:isoleucyl-tRNA synthetase